MEVKLKKSAFLISILICNLTGSLGFAKTSLTLEECYQFALKRSDDLSNQEELITQAEEKLGQANSSILPTVNGTFNYLTQPTPSGLGANISPASQTTAKIVATQPLFRGFREFATIRQQKDLLSVSQLTREQAELQLYQDVVQNFYSVLAFEKDLQNLKNEMDLNRKRQRELEYFKKLGRSRETELLTLESNIASLDVQIENAQGQLNFARDVFVFLTGREKLTPIHDSEKQPTGQTEVKKYLERASFRPDIQALKKSVEASQEGIAIAKGSHLPSVDLLGNYYLSRPGLLSNVSWDVQLALSVPIFQGGVIQAQTRIAESIRRQSEFALSRAQRIAVQQIETFYDQYKSDLGQYEKQKKVVQLGDRNYQAEVRDYKLGLVTNLEVLQVLTSYQQAQRFLNRLEYQLKSDYLRLQSAAALRPVQGAKENL
jgi:outer membrane protein